MKKHKKLPEGIGAIAIDVPIEITNNKMKLSLISHLLCAFAVFDKTFKEKTPSSEELERELLEKEKVFMSCLALQTR